MLKVQFKRITTPFCNAFTTSHETKSDQTALLVAIAYNGLRGIGEAPIISYYPQTFETMVADLKAKAKMIEDYNFTEPERFWHFCHHLFPDNPFLVCALDIAYWDLYAQFKNKTIAEIILDKKVKQLNTFYTLGQDTYENMLAKVEARPWPRYKVKVTDDVSLDHLTRLMEVTKSVFAVDANAAWSLEEAKGFVPRLIDLGVIFIEQPLNKQYYGEMKILKEQFDIPFYADESFQTADDIERCAESFAGINIKLTKCGGLTPAVKIIKSAQEKGLKTMLGCMNETEIGTYAAAQIGSLVDFCDLDGPLLLDAPLKKMVYTDGNIILS